MSQGKAVRIGGVSSGFWGDSTLGTRRLLDAAGIRCITDDHLAGLATSIMVGRGRASPSWAKRPIPSTA